MALLIQKLQDQANSKTATPSGWLTIDEMEKAEVNEQNANLVEFEQAVSQHLPLAAKRAQQVVGSLNDRFTIKVPVSYLTVDDSTTFRILMLVSQEDYLSPEMQAARLFVKKQHFTGDEFDIHYTFTIGTEHSMKSSIGSNSYKLKHMQELEKSKQIELVYLQAS